MADGLTERRNLDGNRRANGWRWGAQRSDRRLRARFTPERRAMNRRKVDRDDQPGMGYPRFGLPERI